MHFQKDHIYHIYNQGNNSRKIFFERDNYLFFLKKLKIYVLPYADILAWCLMPNHFHFMVRVREVASQGLTINAENSQPFKSQGLTINAENSQPFKSQGLTIYAENSQPLTTLKAENSQPLTTLKAENSQPLTTLKAENSQPLTTLKAENSQPLTNTPKARTFNNSIGIMLRSYTRAINKQEGTSGSLFRQLTKAQCIDCPKDISPSWFVENGITVGKVHPSFDYPKVCFDYIHQNPVKARLVESTTDWEFSSAMDYAGIRKGSLINRDVAVQYGLI